MKQKQHLKLLIEDKENGQIICGCGCGHVVETKLIDRSNDSVTDPIFDLSGRSKSSIRTHDGNLTTKMGYTKNPDFNRLAKIQNWTRVADKKEYHLAETLKHILQIAEKLYLSKTIVEEACYFARKIKRDHCRGYTKKTLACILLLLASKRSFKPQSVSIFKPFLPNRPGRSFLGRALEIKEILGLQYEIKPKPVPKKEKPKTFTPKRKPSECVYCGEKTLRTPIILEDGTIQPCCIFCEQRLRINNIKFHREGTKKEADLLRNRCSSISIFVEDIPKLNEAKRQYERITGTRITSPEFTRHILKFYLENHEEALR